MKKLILSSFLLAFTLPAVATPILYKKEYHCPTAHAEHKQLLIDMKDLKNKLKEIGCGEGKSAVGDQVSEIVNLATKEREAFFKIVNTKREEALSAEEAEKVRSYSAKIAEYASSLIYLTNTYSTGFWAGLPIVGGLFSDANKCKLEESEKGEVIHRAASLVYEATNALSQVAGPYGVPLSVGGSTLSGVLSGVATFLDSSDRFDFDDQNNRLFYSEALCLYHKFDIEARRLLNPEAHLAHLKGLDQLLGFLDEKIETIDDQCDSCSKLIEDDIVIGEPDTDSGDAIAQFLNQKESLLQKIDTINQNDNNPNLQLGTEVAEALASKKWVQSEVERIQLEIDRFQNIADSPTIGQEPGIIQIEQNKMKAEMADAAASFLNWLRSDQLPTLRRGFSQQVDTFFARSNKDVDEDFMGCYQKIVSSGLHRYDIVYRHAPETNLQFLECYAQEFSASRKNPNYYFKFQLIYDQWKAWEKNFQAYKEYCRFFTQSYFYPDGVKYQCSPQHTQDMQEQAEEIARVALAMAKVISTDESYPKVFSPHDFSEEHYESYLALESDEPSAEFAFLPHVLQDVIADENPETTVEERVAQAKIELSKAEKQRPNTPILLEPGEPLGGVTPVTSTTPETETTPGPVVKHWWEQMQAQTLLWLERITPSTLEDEGPLAEQDSIKEQGPL